MIPHRPPRLLVLLVLLAAVGQATGQSGSPAAPAAGEPRPLTALASAARLRAKLSYDPLTGYGFFERNGIRAAFAQDQGLFLIDWSAAYPMEPPRSTDGALSFSPASIDAMEEAFDAAEARRLSSFSVAAILIDPGHGGKDPGAIGEHMIAGKRLRIVEKDIALDLAERLRAALKRRYPDKKVLTTREGDSYPTLEERVEMANSVELGPDEAIIYLSIHANSSFNKNARGFEVWYLNPEYRRTLLEAGQGGGAERDIAPILNAMLEEEYTTESIILARDIMGGLQAAVGSESPNRGVRADEWFVVRNARMPSILVEAGFVTNQDEAKLLSRSDYLQRLADGMYNGVVEFVGYFESMKGAPSQ